MLPVGAVEQVCNPVFAIEWFMVVVIDQHYMLGDIQGLDSGQSPLLVIPDRLGLVAGCEVVCYHRYDEDIAFP